MFRKAVADDRSSNAETSFAEFRCCSRHDQMPVTLCAERRPARPETLAVGRQTCWKYTRDIMLHSSVHKVRPRHSDAEVCDWRTCLRTARTLRRRDTACRLQEPLNSRVFVQMQVELALQERKISCLSLQKQYDLSNTQPKNLSLIHI